MRARTIIILALPMISMANPWLISGGIGLGQHQSVNALAETSSQSQWHLFSGVSSALYEGMDGQLSYELMQGKYNNDLLADDNLAIDFRAHMIQSNLRIGGGLGLGVNHRYNITQNGTLNQAYVPFFLDLQAMTGKFTPWRFSLEADYFIHPPHKDFLADFNPITSRTELGLHYHDQQFEYGLVYQTESFANNVGIKGINNRRVEGQVTYHWQSKK